jgi:hypothetical protein
MLFLVFTLFLLHLCGTTIIKTTIASPSVPCCETEEDVVDTDDDLVVPPPIPLEETCYSSQQQNTTTTSTTNFCLSIKVVMVLQDCAKGPYHQANALRQQLATIFGVQYMCYSLAYGYLNVHDLRDYDLIIVDGSSTSDFTVVSDWLEGGNKYDIQTQLMMVPPQHSSITNNLLQDFVNQRHVVWFNAAVPSSISNDTPWPLPYGAMLHPGVGVAAATASPFMVSSSWQETGNNITATPNSIGWVALPPLNQPNSSSSSYETIWVDETENKYNNQTHPILIRRKDLSFWASTLSPFVTKQRYQILQWLCQAVILRNKAKQSQQQTVRE